MVSWIRHGFVRRGAEVPVFETAIHRYVPHPVETSARLLLVMMHDRYLEILQRYGHMAARLWIQPHYDLLRPTLRSCMSQQPYLVILGWFQVS